MLTACDDPTSCVFDTNDAGLFGSTTSLSGIPLEGGVPVWIVLSAQTVGQTGAYTLDVSGPCTPDCTDRTCGDDGCGGSCGTCGPGQLCDATQNCIDPAAIEGNTCNNPFVVASTPYSNTGDTTGLTNDISGCNLGAAGNDAFYSLTPTVTGIYTVGIPTASFDSALYVMSDCTDPNACTHSQDGLGSGGEELTLSLTAGTTYTIIVDGFSNLSNTAGTYTFTVSDPCVPNCQGLVCGSDGCGGSCGDCPPGENCQSGTCAAVGNDCTNPFVADAFPFENSASTAGSSNDFTSGGGACGQLGDSSNDHAYTFVPDQPGVYTLDLVADFDSALYASTNCADATNTCVTANDALGDGGEQIQITALAGESYTVVVDGYANFSNHAGNYTLTISEACTPDCSGKVCGDNGCGGSCGDCTGGLVCDASGQCGPSVACQNAIPLAPDSSTAGTTVGAANDFSSGGLVCSALGGSGPDNAYLLTATVDGTYTVSLTADFDTALYTHSACGDPESCTASDDATGDGGESLLLSLTAGESIYLIVDYWGNFGSGEGTYTIDVSAPCIPACAGKTCGDDGCGGSCGTCSGGANCINGVCQALGNDCTAPFVADSFPYSNSADTSTATNDFSSGGTSCSNYGALSGDHVYHFLPDVTGTYTVSITTASFDTALYVSSSCADPDASCLQAVDDTAGNGTETIVMAAVAGQSYFVYVDYWANFSSGTGTYTLEISAPCVPQCAGLQCGDDGCGTSCGTCPGGQICDASQQCAANPACTAATVVGSLPFTTNGDTTNSSNDFSSAGNNCAARGGGGSDDVYELTATVTGVYTVSVTNLTFDAALYALSTCGDAASCQQLSDTLFFGDESLALSLTAGETVYIVVDYWDNSNDGTGTYTLDISTPCIPQCQGLQCGDDGCGGSCGACNPGDVCGATQQCVPNPGCVAAIPVGPLPFQHQGDTSTQTNDFNSVSGGGCGDLGAASNDQAFTLTAGKTGDYVVTLTPQFDAALYVQGTCGDTASCQGSDDQLPPQAETLTLTLTAGEVVTIVVDGWNNSFDESGPYILDITGPPPTYADVQPIFQARCGGCHGPGSSGSHQIGTQFGAAEQGQSYYCAAGVSKAACTVVRMKDGSMPFGGGCQPYPADNSAIPGCPTIPEIDSIQAWVDAGTLP